MREECQYDLDAYYEYFESWPDVIEAAGVDIRQRLIDDLQRVSDEVGGQPTTTQIDAHGQYDANQYGTYFGSWSEALEAAGLTPTSEEELLNEIRTTYEELGKVPNPDELNEHGTYRRKEYTELFGSLSAAIQQAGLDYKAEIIDALQEVAVELGRPPSTTEFASKSRYNTGAVYKFFDEWEAALSTAGVDTKDAIKELQRDRESEPQGETVPRSELAEYYESVSNLRELHKALYGGAPEEVLPADDPMTQWADLVAAVRGDEGLADWERGYGLQQNERNEFRITEYRSEYGNGERITEFNCIDTTSPSAAITELVADEPLEPTDLAILVAPESATPLPVLVEDRPQLERAHELLAELPTTPKAATPEAGGEQTVPGETPPNDEPPDQPSRSDDELTQVSGVTDQVAQALIDANIETVQDLKASSIGDLEAVEGVTKGQALRIKADVGGNE
jgi:predicted flap endonuclease-1-like 5' DNA nuclease